MSAQAMSIIDAIENKEKLIMKSQNLAKDLINTKYYVSDSFLNLSNHCLFCILCCKVLSIVRHTHTSRSCQNKVSELHTPCVTNFTDTKWEYVNRTLSFEDNMKEIHKGQVACYLYYNHHCFLKSVNCSLGRQRRILYSRLKATHTYDANVIF